MTEVINDMEAVRIALGYERINLLGESYGTRVETIYERMYPDSLNRVVMVAVNPPGHFVWDPDVVDAQIEDYARLCANDPDCSTRTHDLVASMRHVSENMPDHWLFMPIDPDMVKFMSFLMFMESATPSDSPVQFSGPAAIDMWLAAEKGDPSGMAILSLMGRMIAPNSFIFGDLLAKASSGGDFIDPAVNARERLDPSGSVLGSPMSLLYSGMIDGWSKHLIPEEYWQMQPTHVETLLVSGSIDFSTPPQFAAHELLPYLTNGRQVILKDFGHSGTFWSSQPEARAHMLNTFFDTGKLDDSLYKYQPVNFNVGLGMPGMAKLSLGIVATVIVVLAALVWAIVRRLRSRLTAQSQVAKPSLSSGF
jgi:pimeloyl-ACP methyl ester carboxylesterase